MHISEKSVVNAMVGLLATGGSTNETMHLVAIAMAASIRINWDDFSDLSDVIPLIVRIYPNGPGDINSFQQAGGMALLIHELLKGGLVHEDIQTVAGQGLSRYQEQPTLDGKTVRATNLRCDKSQFQIDNFPCSLVPTDGVSQARLPGASGLRSHAGVGTRVMRKCLG